MSLHRLTLLLDQVQSAPRRVWTRLIAVIDAFLGVFTPQRSRRLIVGLFSAFILVIALTPGASSADLVSETLDKLGTGIFVLLNSVLYVMLQTVAMLTSLVVSLLVAISQFNKFSTVHVVDVGWTIVKDVSNMLFIIALLVIAAGTVLRLENYRYNRLLSNLVIMAFLTNFSKFIAAFFIQGAQVLMLTFVNAFKDALFGNFVSGFGLDKVLQFVPDASPLAGSAIFANLLGGLILVVIALIVTAAICIVLFTRIVALWILVILSPLAFATQILPNTKSFATRWWSEFGKYVTQGPILAFFLWLALAIVTVGNGATAIDPSLGTIAAEVNRTRNDASFFQVEIFTIDSLMTFVISATFLIFGLNYATSSSGVAGKWAGKVASAGFAGARAIGGTVTGINAVRDRVVAPLQGWQKNREDQRRATVAERTQTFVNAGDRVRASVPSIGNIGREGKEKARAAANVYERQRTQRMVQARGMQDMKNDELQDRFQKSGDQRERLAAAQVLAQRSAINLQDGAQQKALGEVLNSKRTPFGVIEDLKKQVYGQNIGVMNPEQLRGAYAAAQKSGNTTAANAFGAALVKNDLLDAKEPKDQSVVRELLVNLQQNTQELKNFRATLMKENPEMAKKVLFNDLAEKGDRQGYLAAMQQGEMSPSTITKDTLKKFSDAGEAGAIGDHLIKTSPDTESLRRFKQSMDPEVAEEVFKNITVADETTLDERQRIARATGQWSKAFTLKNGTWITEDQIGEDGKPVIGEDGKPAQVSSAKLFMDKLGGDEVSKTIANDSLRDENVLQALRGSDNMKFPHWEAIRNRSKETRTALTEGLTAYADKLAAANPDGKINLNPDDETNPNHKENNFVVSNLALASKGKDLRHDLTSESGMNAFENLVRGSKAADLAKLTDSDAYKDEATRKLVNQTYGMHAEPAKISDMLQFENTQFAKDSLEAAEAELLKRYKGGDRKALTRLKAMALNPTLSGFINVPDESDTKGSSGAVVAVPPRPDASSTEKREKKGKDVGSGKDAAIGSDDYKRSSIGFGRDIGKKSDGGPDTGGAPAPTKPTKPRGPSGAPQNILIGTLTPEQREARKQVINVRQANRGKIPDAQFNELAQKILKAEDLKTYRELSNVPSQVLSDDDRKMMQEFQTQLGIRGSDAQSPSEYLTSAQLKAREELVSTRQQNNGRIPEAQLRQLGETILGSNEFNDFTRLASQPSQVLSDPDRELLKDLSIRLGYIEPGA